DAAWQLLSPAEHEQITTTEAELKRQKSGEDYKQIRTALEALNQATMRLADLMMNTAVTSALQGKTMDQTGIEDGPRAAHPIAPAEISKD
ncbi:MAG TPA: molecular chaperone DnaK, partial [Alphaproteobacteria bacterium]|nr:molecular chaperone DnaK [Alphaproteobacteria bacterium]